MDNAAENKLETIQEPVELQPSTHDVQQQQPLLNLAALENVEHREERNDAEFEDGDEVFCDGPGARTRSKMGQDATTVYGKLTSPSFLVQIPFYALKKEEKNRKCSVCGKHGRTPSDLLRHMRVHTGERPFPCVGCDKKFKCKRSQLTHQYLTHSITDGLSTHRLQILELKKMKRLPKHPFSVSPCDIPPVLENQILQNNISTDEQEQGLIDEDEDTEIVAEDESISNTEMKTTFEGFFKSQVPEDQQLDEPPIITTGYNEFSNSYSRESNIVNNKELFEERECENSEKQEDKEIGEVPILEAIDMQPIDCTNHQAEQKVPILRIKTHKCTHCKRQFRSIYTLRYHLRSMHDEKVYLIIKWLLK